ncbi:Undecaprenyl-diphosphatase [Candidatus Nitrosocosmicus arcticus]|uniref:Undecaprenyl-diphosphatase n=1 Tax=Candidatus Nitrosocosmicus arcticus TaxID=2035267 RepID=A0A557SYW6_9ARCH|nr:Undecaprenyl-diphosphatase [Candidatus Nitrosocosmicus arcticus]
MSPRTQLSNNFLLDSDNTLFLIINNSHYQFLNQFMMYLTLYGREVFWVLVILFLLIFGKENGRKTTMFILVTMIILVPIGMMAKEIIERLRPIVPEADFLMLADSEYSFPSGHALMVSAGATITLILFRDSRKELAISVLLVVEAALVCFSRVYVGGHYPLDVLGGILLGVGISFVFIWKEKWLKMLYLRINNKFFKVKI